MPRWMGVDYGSRRIGVAISDYGGSIASPAAVLPGSGSLSGDARQIVAWARKNEVSAIVVGLPLNMDGTVGPQADISTKLAAEIAQAAPEWPVELWDERLSSFEADANLAAAGARPSRRRELRDALAAQVILQSFLDSKRAGK
ncbi:MAG: Holliday junction resolvase RuvX [Phycisphaerae bacterium]|jgi:putative Holliday junction resolvase|nr:Holliday junction resolvase RuvX [Phycisphaerae bacterium]HOO15954.1 Holliday junction resolvase RuvX [Phycisphaerae bacterium]HPC23051.1 Holliday junction resolvase RuvX [Phycisphaerae bacterium]HRS27650.1 Holliday junction resolvase RuvX [Phycisphaerae bacterium]HRT40989.1 Holliday junction resolvase RuvX [Phycisphaerae bacterium]